MPKIRQRKALSQVFLKSVVSCQAMLDQLQEWKIERVLEIGPGSGMLTRELLASGYEVTSVEPDERFVALLRSEFAAQPLEVVHSGIEDFAIDRWLDDAPQEGAQAVVGNIPYHLSTPIIQQVLPHLRRVRGSLMLVQDEFASRLCSEPGRKSYGSLSVYVQMRAAAAKIAAVPKEDFQPVPKVDSAIIRLEHFDTGLTDAQLRKVEVFAKHAFAQRRKKLRNSLKPFLGERDPDSAPIDLTLRPEALSKEQFIALAQFLTPELWV